MESTVDPRNVPKITSSSSFLLLLSTLLIGGFIVVFRYVVGRRSRREQDSSKDSYAVPAFEPSSQSLEDTTQPTFAEKRPKNKKRREQHQEFTHLWLTATLKGHTGLVSDMAFSSNGKYLASCAEDSEQDKVFRVKLADFSLSNLYEPRNECQIFYRVPFDCVEKRKVCEFDSEEFILLGICDER